MHRGSLEVGDMLSDVSAVPMEMTLLGVQGKVSKHHTAQSNTMVNLDPHSSREHLDACTVDTECASCCAEGARGHDGCCHLCALQHSGCITGGCAAVSQLACAGHWPLLWR